MDKKQDRVATVLAADRDPLVDTTNLDEAFIDNPIGSSDHKRFRELLLRAFACHKSGEHVDSHEYFRFLFAPSLWREEQDFCFFIMCLLSLLATVESIAISGEELPTHAGSAKGS